MLTKLPSVRYIPGTPYVPPVPAVPHVPAHTVCGAPPRDSWTEYECSTTKLYLETNTGVQIPWGASIVRYGEDDGGLYVIYSVCRTVTKYGPPKPVVCTDYPEQPGVPGVPAVPAVPGRTEIINLYGWDSGANSVDIIDAPARVQFQQPAVVGSVLGFTTDRAAVPAVDRYAHAFYFYQTAGGAPRYALREFTRTFQSDNPYEDGDTFEIRINGARVEYLHNGTPVRASRAALDAELSVGATLYASGDVAPGSGGGAPPEPEPEPTGYTVFSFDPNVNNPPGETEMLLLTNDNPAREYGEPWWGGVFLDGLHYFGQYETHNNLRRSQNPVAGVGGAHLFINTDDEYETPVEVPVVIEHRNGVGFVSVMEDGYELRLSGEPHTGAPDYEPVQYVETNEDGGPITLQVGDLSWTFEWAEWDYTLTSPPHGVDIVGWGTLSQGGSEMPVAVVVSGFADP